MKNLKDGSSDSTGELPTTQNSNPRPGSLLAIYMANRDYILAPLRDLEKTW